MFNRSNEVQQIGKVRAIYLGDGYFKMAAQNKAKYARICERVHESVAEETRKMLEEYASEASTPAIFAVCGSRSN